MISLLNLIKEGLCRRSIVMINYQSINFKHTHLKKSSRYQFLRDYSGPYLISLLFLKAVHFRSVELSMKKARRTKH